MPWSSGVYSRFYPSWVADANNGLPISASKFDGEDNDLASGLNNCLTIDGLNKPTSTLNWSVQMNWTRGTDGNLWSLARTGGSNNPKLQAAVTDASGITLTMTGGSLTLAGPAASDNSVALAAPTGHQAKFSVQGNGGVAGTSDFLVSQDGSGNAFLTNNLSTGSLNLSTNGTNRLSISAAGLVIIAQQLGVNGNPPPPQVTGFGTPTGFTQIANFPGNSATLLQCSQTIAQIIKDLKAIGFYAA